MSDLVAARLEMALSLAFHIVFAVMWIAMPLFMVIAEIQNLRTGDPAWLHLTKRWAKGTAIMFAVGAVSGTVISFELGLLWPRLMGDFGSVIGIPFALEGFAFFTEAIFLGIYLYGWERVSPRLHVAAGVVVALSGVASAAFVVTANAWMNVPSGFRMEGGRVVDVQPFAPLGSPAAFHEILHVVLSTYAAAGFAVAGVNAWFLLKDPASKIARHALVVGLTVGGVAAMLLGPSGHISAQAVAKLEPVKLAALEGHFKTEKGAPLRIGGYPDLEARTTRFAIEIPYALSILAFDDPHAEVKGLDDFPRDEQPDPRIVHFAFQVMVAIGSWLMVLTVFAAFLRFVKKKAPWESKLLLRALLVTSPLGFVAVEAGWVVTECGRQPWIVKGIMKTADAVTPVKGIAIELFGFLGLYVLLAVVVVKLGRWHLSAGHDGGHETSHG